MFGLVTAALSATVLLLQEHFKAHGFAMAFWIKVACAIVTLPFVIATGLPGNPMFYALLAAQSLLWVVSDVIFYRGVKEAGAGVISRIMPIATIVGFLVWFLFDPALAGVYLARPWNSAAILGVFALSAFFAFHVRKCHVTMNALRAIWFVLAANVIGNVMNKFITLKADLAQGPYAYTFFQALVMIAIWSIYYMIRRPLPHREMFSKKTIKAGLIAGVVAAGTVTAGIYAVYHADNPAYVSSMRYLDTVLILLFYRATGKPSRGNVWASLGIVACASALIVLKARG